ncbi:MAG TPA: amidohydrolase family protein [Anaerolineales bacterium]|nr:amidohydrolase family protein [Anaerolineales bacterium]HMZ43374.1 amidohydrolase family protein [Anaerolineales bacterium]HND92326.1 amidohydrolase family protein [Anaerolineales bacterium]HNH05810.1 amidohydrolase family protein [Anaerolineales bacterium]HNJ12516.1 amidohydrolase family protein [Anaerolineales bacterium]
MKQENSLPQEQLWNIYNCHIHTFTQKNTPGQFYKLLLTDSHSGKMSPLKVVFVLLLPFLLIAFSPLILFMVILDYIRDGAERNSADQNGRMQKVKKKAINRLAALLAAINPASDDLLERYARFLNTSASDSQETIFKQIKHQYPENAKFVILPMDMEFMNLGAMKQSIEDQHADLLKLAAATEGSIIPFYAVDPRHEDIVERVKANLAKDKFRGIKIYPNLGYKPNHERLMDVYKICGDTYPVISHCSPSGIWQYGLSESDRINFGHPENYIPVLKENKKLRLCLAHFGGAEEWVKHLKGQTPSTGDGRAWVRVISDMLTSGNYPNLYTDISYTIFMPKVNGLYIDLVDYLKVLLSNKQIREHVLFGSDYYMVEQERISEKEASILLRSRLGEDLYRQIAYTNPRKFLGIK